MEERIKESKEICRKRDEEPLDREPLSNSLPNYVHSGLDNVSMQVSEKKQWIILTGIIRAGLKSEKVTEEIKEVQEEYE